MSTHDYLIGLLFFAGIWGGTGLAALLVARRHLAHLRGAPLVLAVSLLWTVGLLVAAVLPGALTILSRGTVLATALLLLVGALAWPASGDGPADQRAGDAERREPESRASRALAVAGVGLFALFAIATTVQLAGAAPGNIDTLSFHLPVIARWIQTGSIWHIHQFIPQVATGPYPGNGNAIELTAILPWRNDFLFRELNLLFLAIMALALFATAKELGAPRTLAGLIAAATASMPVVMTPALESPQPDIIMLAGFATGVLFLVRHFHNDRTSELVLAGLALGVAFGTKWYGVTSVPFLVGVWAACSLGAGRPLRVVARQTAVLAALVVTVGGIWLVRNWIQAGDPIFPAKVAIGGITIFDAPPDPRGTLVSKSIADYATDLSVIRHGILPAFWTWYAFSGFLLFAAYLGAGGTLAARWARVDRRRRWLLLGLIVSAALLAVIYFETPSSSLGASGQAAGIGANTRYGVPALLLAAAAAGWLGGLGRRWLLVAEALALAAVIDGLALGFTPSSNSVAAVLFAFGVVFLARRWLIPAWRRLGASGRRAAAVGLATATLAGGAAVGYATQRKFNDHGYGGYATVDWVLAHAPEGRHIGLAGAWTERIRSPIRALFGPEFRNHVNYVGTQRKGWLTPYYNRRDFQAAVRRNRFDLLFLGTYKGYGPPFSEMEGWARDAGWVLVAKDPQLAVYRNSRTY